MVFPWTALEHPTTPNIPAFVIHELLHVLMRFLLCFFLAGMLFLSLAGLQSLVLRAMRAAHRAAALGRGPPPGT